MGDRAMAEIKTEDGSLYFYTHWAGSELLANANTAVNLARPRQGDDAYAAKIVVDALIKLSGARDAESGAGLMLKPNAEDSYNSDNPSVVIDLATMAVTSLRSR